MPYDIYSNSEMTDSNGEPLRNFAIECIDVVTKNVYLGTADGTVVHYILDESNPTKLVRQNTRFIGVKKPVIQLKCASSRVLTLCDAGIWLLNGFDLEHSTAAKIPKLKDVTCFSVNESPSSALSSKPNPFCIDVAVAHRLKRALSLYKVDNDGRFLLQKEILLPDVLLSMVYDGPCVCAALADRYCVVRCGENESGTVTDVLFYEELITRPLVRLVTRTSFVPNLASANATDFLVVSPEFAIIGPDRLCVFVGFDGPSSRAPIPLHVASASGSNAQLSSLVDLLVVADSPYLVALAADSKVYVHSTLDCGAANATLKQSLPLNTATCLANAVLTSTSDASASRVLVGSKRAGLQALVALSLEQQVEALLKERKPFEAFDLLQSAKVVQRARVAAKREAYDRLLRLVAAHCGFARFCDAQFDEARRFFLDAHLDVRELLLLFTDLRLHVSESFTRQLAAEVPDIDTLCQQRLAAAYLREADGEGAKQGRLAAMRAEYYQFALHFLVETRSSLRLRRAESIAFASEVSQSLSSSQILSAQLSVVDTALVQLYAAVDARSLEAFLSSNAISSPQPDGMPSPSTSTLHCDVDSCRSFCETRGSHFCLALIDAYVKHDHENACRILASLVRAELVDPAFPGVAWFANYLALRPSSLLLTYSHLLLERDPPLAVRLLAERTRFSPPSNPANRSIDLPENKVAGRAGSMSVRTQSTNNGQSRAAPDVDRMEPETVVDYLQHFPVANAQYLEWLVLDRRVDSERFHTQLAALLSDALVTALREAAGDVDLLKNDDKIARTRATLCRVLEESCLYRVQSVLHRLNDTPFYQELTILFSKLGEHERALRLMIHKMDDLAGAEQYCLRVSATTNSNSNDNNISKNNAANSAQTNVDNALRKQLFFTLLGILLEDSRLAHAAIALLNRLESNCVETVRALNAVPSDWQLSAVDRFVLKTLHELVTRSAMACIGVQLARFEQLEMRAALCRAQRAKIVLTDERVCSVCKRLFEQASFVLHRNGAITHIHCSGSVTS